MPLETREFNLSEEIERIESDIQSLANEASEYDTNTPHFEQAENESTRLNMMRVGLEAITDIWDVETVTLGALTPGEYADMERFIPSDATSQARRNVFAAAVTVDAPYAADSLEDTLANITTEDTDVHPYFTRWVENRGNELLRGGSGNTNPFYGYLTDATNPAT